MDLRIDANNMMISNTERVNGGSQLSYLQDEVINSHLQIKQ